MAYLRSKLGTWTAILIMAASIRAGQSWDLRLPYASLRVTLRVGTQKQPTFMHLLTGLRLQHPPRGSNSPFWGRCRINAAFRQVWERRIYAAARRQSENCRAPKAKMRIAASKGGEGGTRSGGRFVEEIGYVQDCDLRAGLAQARLDLQEA